jgi:phosphoglycolate phosphatase-like HAD superfamily hydrolase
VEPPSYTAVDNTASDVSGAANGSYGGGYGEQRELTAEEQEEQEYQSIVDEGKQIKRDGIASLQRSKQEGYRALGIVAGTNVRLAEQEEMLRNAEKNLDIANAHHKIANDKTSELQTVTRSMFAVHVPNPFTKGKREARLEQAVLERHREERDVAEETRKGGYLAKQQNAQAFEPMMMGRPKPPAPNAEAAAQRRQQLAFDENDAEDVALENDIDKEQDEISELVSQLKDAAVYQGVMVGRQTKLVDVLGDKVSHQILIQSIHFND